MRMENKDKIIQGDCIEVMRGFPDKSFDLVYADPPFNTQNSIGWYSRSYDGQKNDALSPEEYVDFCKSWFTEARRVGKRLIITPGVVNICLYPNPLWCVVISKPSSPSFNRLGGFNCWEPLFVYDKPITGKRLSRDVVVYDSQNFDKTPNFHPCPDNVEMVRWIVNTWSKEGETVLDPFLGSGSSLLAAKMLKRNGIGIEMSQEYCNMSRKRIERG